MKSQYIKLYFILFLVLIQSINSSKFLPRYQGENECPNPKVTSLALLISFAEAEQSLLVSKLKPEEKEPYERMVGLKRSFSTTMSYVPQSFSPERQSYWDDLDFLFRIFIFIAIVPAFCVIFYIVMRFIFKKCVGPQKVAKVNKNYRNLTWALMILSSAAVTILFIIILSKSTKVHNGIDKAFESAAEKIAANDDFYNSVNKVVVQFRNKNLNVPDEEYMSDLKSTIETYFSNTKKRTQQIIDDESARQSRLVIVFIFVNVLTVFAYLFFFCKLEKLERILAILMLFVFPFMIVFEGYNAKFFFYYGDICDTVNGALYSNEIPVADQALGYYYNCLPLKTKAQLYQIRFRLYDSAYNQETQDADISNAYEGLNKGYLEDLFNCKLLSEVIPMIEQEFCQNGLEEMYNILLLLTWLLIAIVAEAIATRRLEVLIWKRRNEIESMIQNREVLF